MTDASPTPRYRAKTSSGKVVVTSSPTARIATADGYKNIQSVGVQVRNTASGGGGSSRGGNVTTTATQTTQTTQAAPVQPANTLNTLRSNAALSGQGFSVQSKEGDGYVLSSGEFTRDRTLAEADAGAQRASVQRLQETTTTSAKEKGVVFESSINTGLPFFSKEGQKQRLKNVVNVLSIGTGVRKNRIKSEIGGTTGRVTEWVAEHPFSTAGIVASGFQIGAGLYSAGKVGIGAGVTKMAASKSGMGAVGTGLKEGGKSLIGWGTKQTGASAVKKGFFYTGVRTTQQLAVQTATGAGVVKGSELIGYARTPEDERRYFEDVEASRAGYAEQQKSIKGVLPVVADAVSVKLGDLATKQRSKESYAAGVKAYYENQGLTGAELQKAVNAQVRSREARGWGEVSSLLVTSAQTERFAQKELARYGKNVPIPKLNPKEFMKQFNKPVLSTLGRAGFIEGFSQSVAQDTSRTQPVSLKKAGISGGIGAASAIGLGYPIIRSQVTGGRYGILFKSAGYLTDPYEYAGDKIAAGWAKAQSAVGFKVAVPTLSLTPSSKGRAPKAASFSTTFTNTQTPAQTSNNKPKGRVRGLFSFGLTSTPSYTDEYIPPKIGGITPSPSDTPSNIPINIPSDTPANTPTNTNTNTNTNTRTTSQTTTTTNTLIPTIISTPVNTITPQLRIPPPLPLGFDFGTGAGLGSGARGKKGYVNELSAGIAIFKGLTTGQRVIEKSFIRPIKKPKRRVKMRRRR